MDKKDTRPFNLEHALAGAPIACRNGYLVEIFKWNGKQAGRPIMGAAGLCDYPAAWGEDGTFENRGGEHELDLVMTALGYIDGKPVFVGDELVDKDNGRIVQAGPKWGGMNQDLWAWPAPAKQYPVSGMGEQELLAAAGSPAPLDWANGFLRVANAALRHAIDAGQVVLP